MRVELVLRRNLRRLAGFLELPAILLDEREDRLIARGDARSKLGLDGRKLFGEFFGLRSRLFRKRREPFLELERISGLDVLPRALAFPGKGCESLVDIRLPALSRVDS